MSTTYFITGLPRSRTAWLANLLTYGCSFCWHDAVKFGGVRGIVEAMERAYQMPRVSVAGNSDSSLSLVQSELFLLYPMARWVIVKSDFETALNSFIKAFTADHYIGIPSPNPDVARSIFEQARRRLELLESRLPAARLLKLDVADLDESDAVEAVWNFCVPDEPFNVERWRQLDGLRVSVIGHKISVQTAAAEVAA